MLWPFEVADGYRRQPQSFVRNTLGAAYSECVVLIHRMVVFFFFFIYSFMKYMVAIHHRPGTMVGTESRALKQIGDFIPVGLHANNGGETVNTHIY